MIYFYPISPIESRSYSLSGDWIRIQNRSDTDGHRRKPARSV